MAKSCKTPRSSKICRQQNISLAPNQFKSPTLTFCRPNDRVIRPPHKLTQPHTTLNCCQKLSPSRQTSSKENHLNWSNLTLVQLIANRWNRPKLDKNRARAIFLYNFQTNWVPASPFLASRAQVSSSRIVSRKSLTDAAKCSSFRKCSEVRLASMVFFQSSKNKLIRYTVTQSYNHKVAKSHNYTVTQLHTTTQSQSCTVTVSHCHTFSKLHSHTVHTVA